MNRWLRYHRTLPPVYDRLKRHAWEAVPEQARRELSQLFSANVTRHLGNAAELARLSRLLSENGIRHLAFKGPTLALRAYGNLNLRHAGDLDVLVDPAQFEGADAVLQAAGYRLVRPDFEMSPRQSRVFRTIFHHFVHRAPDGATTIELHWRLTCNRFLLPVPFEQLADRSQDQVIAGHPIPTLSDADTALYLFAHGANHAWFRLFWLCDVVGFIEQTDSDWPDVLARAAEIGLDRPVLHAALLTHHLLDRPMEDAILDGAMREPGMTRMLRLVVDRLVTQYDAYDPTVPGLIRGNIWYATHLRRDWAYKRAVLHRISSRFVEDGRMVPLPDTLSPLHYLLQLPLRGFRKVVNR